ncbi:MAG: hypothetical protein FJX46_01825 [Alphaproteobacteria bacterium]|nr:hypothetical protein [Alphaproteobacteria bacterium]
MSVRPGARFDLDDYAALVEAVLARGYAIQDYAGADPAARDLILRHDVDFDLQAAVEMGAVEAARDWRSTYFVLLRSEFYNLLAPASKTALLALLDHGHEVGLHFDASLYRPDELIEAAAREARMLGDWIGRAVTAFSFHRPNPERLSDSIAVPGMINAYDARYFRAMGYCSDSRGAWHHGHPLDHPALSEGRALHLLTHPIWWTGSGNPQRRIEGFLDQRTALLDVEAARNCSAYVPRRS